MSVLNVFKTATGVPFKKEKKTLVLKSAPMMDMN